MLSILKKLLSLLPAGDKSKLILLFLMMLFGAFFEMVGIGMIPIFVSIIAAPDLILNYDGLKPIWEALGINDAGGLLIFGSLLLICIYTVKNAYVILYRYIQARFIWGRFTIIGANLFKQYMSAPYEFHMHRNSAELLRNVTQEAQNLANFVMTPFLMLVMDLVLILSIFGMLIWIEPWITIGVFLLLGGGGGLFVKLIKEKIRSFGKRAQHDRGLMIKVVNEALGGLKETRVLNREEWFNIRFTNYIKRYAKSQTFREVSAIAGRPVIETIAVCGMLLIGLMLYWQGRGLESVIPILTLFGAATIRLLPSIQQSAKAYTDLRYYAYSVEPIYNDTDIIKKQIERNYFSDSEDKTELIFEESIRFNGVTYRYPNSDVQAVSDLNLAIPKGDAVGFVGASGAGKTTVIDLLLGLLVPEKGQILVDGKNIQLNLSSWQKKIGYIPQFIFLADDTIRRNIAFGLPDEEIDNDSLMAALEAAQLLKFVESLPEGIDTIIGENGARLSGGQRQRIGIARALYHNPDVLILDEATSALDNQTEKTVIEAIERLKGERTIIMIAHRLSTVQGCDKLYLMEKGEILKSGSYDELFEGEILTNAQSKKSLH